MSGNTKATDQKKTLLKYKDKFLEKLLCLQALFDIIADLKPFLLIWIHKTYCNQFAPKAITSDVFGDKRPEENGKSAGEKRECLYFSLNFLRKQFFQKKKILPCQILL